MKKILIFLVAIALWGCGSSENSALVSGTDTLAPTLLNARLVDENGLGLENVDVVAHERTTNLKYTATTGVTGAFTLQTPAGVYDVGFNSSDPSKATCFYGPVTTPMSGSKSFVLHEGGGRSAGAFFGRLWLGSGVPAGFKRIVLRPSLVHSGSNGQLPTPLDLQTAADGSFEASLSSGQSVSLDFEIYNDTGLDQWVDVASLGKPCYVEFATQVSPVKNRLRASESDGPGYRISSRAQFESVRPKLVTTFNAVGQKDMNALAYQDSATLTGGLLTVDLLDLNNTVNIYLIRDLIATGIDQVEPRLREFPITVDNDGSWWWKYAVNIKRYGSVEGTHWDFTDETGDTYGLTIFSSSVLGSDAWHKVSYNSKKPNIVKIFGEI